MFGDDLGVDGNYTANDACCYCGGGTECSNLEGWVDIEDDDCAWYILYDSPGCPLYGDMYPNDDGITANDACCYCQAEAFNGKLHLVNIFMEEAARIAQILFLV